MRHQHSNRVNTSNDLPAQAWPWEPNWIDYRHSLVMADKRGDLHDDLLRICAGCGCEFDIVPAPHSPNCKAPL